MRALIIATAALVAAILLILWVLMHAAAASKACPTRAEAKAIHHGAYLYWHRNADGQRCWSSRRGGRAEPHRLPRRAVQVMRDAPAPPIILPAGLMPPHLSEPEPRSILDSPRWAWIAQARATDSDLEAGPVWTSFDGPEPDTWPPLPQPAPFNAAGVTIIVATGLLAMAFGLGLWRWQLNRVRLT